MRWATDGVYALVRTHACQGIIDVGDGDDACISVNLFALQMVRVTAAIDVLMVLQCDGGEQNVVGKHLFQSLPACIGMTLHQPPFIIGEMTGFREDFMGDGDLTKVMQQAAEREL